MSTVKKYNTTQFSWEPQERCFYTNAARLIGAPECPFGPLPDNHHGFFMLSVRTGKEVCFRIMHVNWSRADKIMSWVLVPSSADLSVNPELKNVQCIIYND